MTNSTNIKIKLKNPQNIRNNRNAGKRVKWKVTRLSGLVHEHGKENSEEEAKEEAVK